MDGNFKTFGIVRELDSLGRIVIPKETRDLLGIRLEDPIEFFVDENTIIVRRYKSNCCLFCMDSNDLVHFHNQLICKSCIKDVLKKNQEQGPPVQAPPVSDDRRRSKSDKLKQVEDILREKPNLRQQELAEMLGISQGYVSQLLRKLNNS
ncbi:MAG: regulator [Paenibacillaceae bacterium]|nr:regulator [Paenibacillaceae bacterium]